jgi:hypothetical protein
MLRQWPVALWPLVSVASLLILMGSTGNAGQVLAGAALALVAFGTSVYLALSRRDGRPRPREALWPLLGLGGFYVLCAIAAAAAGPVYAIAALAAGVIPMTALAIMVAVARAKTSAGDGGLSDSSREADDDPFPGIGFDEGTPLGDTPDHAEDGPAGIERERQRRFARRRRERDQSSSGR